MANLTVEEAERIAEKAVEDALTKMGLNPENVHDAQADMIYLRRQRMASEQISTWTKRFIVTTFLTGLASALWLGIKSAFAQ